MRYFGRKGTSGAEEGLEFCLISASSRDVLVRMKTISIVTPGYNEAGNIEELCQRIRTTVGQFPELKLEHIFIDNASTDDSVEILRKIAAKDSTLKVIVNSRNFGHIRSPYHAILQATGDAVVLMASDLQDPPSMLADFIRAWIDKKAPICIAVKKTSEESFVMFSIRKLYYRLLAKVSDSPQIQNFTGFGLYDRKVVEQFRKFKDPYPFFRGIVAEVGFDRVEIPFDQPLRKRGITKNNFLTLYDIGMLGIISYSKLPLRLASFMGFAVAGISLLSGLVYFLYKLFFWNSFQVGMAPLVIGMFFIGAVQLLFLGIVGEYVAGIYTQVKDRPLVIEKERIGFDGDRPTNLGQ